MSKFENHSNYNCKITTDTDEEYLIYVNWIHNQKLDTWQGWSCDAGNTRFYIDKDFNIWDGECKNRQLGNVLAKWDIVTNNICNLPTCSGCTDDLLARKHTNE